MIRIAALGMGAMMLAGCVSVLPEPVVPDSLYRLRSSELLTDGAPVRLPVSVVVFEPEGSSLLMGKGIVFEDESGTLSVMRKSQWSDYASRLLQNALMDRLSVRDPDSKGVALDERAGAFAPVELRWQVRDYFVRDSDAIVSLRVTVMTSRSREILGQYDVVKTEAFTGKPETEGVEALVRASRSAVDTVATDLPPYLDQIELMAESSKR